MKIFKLSLLTLPLLAACASGPTEVADPNATLPAEVRVPAGNKPALKLKATGQMIWSCEFKGPPTDNKYDWAFQQYDARLLDQDGKQVGRLMGNPGEFDYWAGSVVTGTPVATAPAGADSVPLQLLKAGPATGNHGAFKGTTFIQRLATKGGVSPADGCNWLNHRGGRKIPYEAEYIFYKAG